MTAQLDIFEPDPIEVERVAALLFDTWSGAWRTLPDHVRWTDLRSDDAKDKWRAVAKAALNDRKNGATP